jgi:hypothetical protein
VGLLEAIGEALGAEHFRGFGSASEYSSYQSNELSAFALRSGACTLIVQRREQTILEIRARMDEPGRRAPDGEVLREQLEIRAATDEIAATVEPALETLIAQLSEEIADPFNPRPATRR